MDSIMFVVGLLTATLRMAAPLIFAGLGGIFSERAGVVNIGLDGMMTIGAFFSILVTYFTGSPVIGIFGGMVAGGVIAIIHAVLSIHLRADQVISGTAINIFSAALAAFLIPVIFETGGQTPTVETLPFVGNIDIPILGEFITGLNWFVILAVVLVVVSSYVLYKTPFGLRLRAVGEHPKAADTLGINVYIMRYTCVIISGMLAGLGGAALSVGTVGIYRDGMVAGRGFIAIAAMIFGNWKPKGTLLACLLFGFAQAFQIKAQGFGFSLPTEFYAMIPYVLTMLALAGFVGKTTGPKASGQPYEKGQR